MSSTVERIQSALSNHREFRETLDSTEYSLEAFKEQSRLIRDIESDSSELDKTIRQLEQKRQKEQKEHESYSQSKGKKFLYSATGQSEKFAKRQSKEEREYQEALDEEQKAKSRRDDLQQTLKEARAHADKLADVKAQHKNARSGLDDLYAGVFTASDHDMPEEAAAKRAAVDAWQAHEAARAAHDSSQQAHTLLTREGSRLMNAAQASMDRARSLSRADMMGFDAYGYTDMKERDAIHTAEVSFMQLTTAVADAHRADPNVVAKLPPVDFHRGNIMSDMVFDNIFTDMHFHDKIKGTQAQLATARQALEAQIQAAAARVRENKDALDRKKKDWLAVHHNLDRVRNEAFQNYGQQPPAYTPQAS